MNNLVKIMALALGLTCSAQAGQTELLNAYSAIEDHINSVTVLGNTALKTHETTIKNNAGIVGNNVTTITASLDLVETYETVKGALFINGTTAAGFSRTDKSNADKALAHCMIAVYQAILDDVYNASNLATHRALLDGYKFVSANFWPGEATPPADSNAVYSVQINASQPTAWGYPVDFGTLPARRPTGAYLAPGSIATVTVPAALVGKGFEIRVGSHVADLKNRPNDYKRMNRVTLTYPINAVSTEVANPLGGALYIEVPYEVEEGVVTVEIQNTIRAPFYSNTPHRQTSLSEWQNTERLHPGPWADFESEKFMLNVPTDWIYAYDNAVTMMANWDKAMDACSDLQGLPRVRPKTVLYCQVDATLDANAFSPGYPQSNDNYNPNSSAGGNKNHDYLNGPKYADFVHLHEFGHASAITKFNGEVEALVNFFNVPMHNRMFDVPFEESFGRSMGNNGCKTVSRDQAALLWILSDKFRSGSFQAATDMKYQHRGYGKYAEIAALFGWDALGDFWKSVAVDYENGISYPKNTDPAASRIIRMSRAADANLMPLIHMWGVAPGNRTLVQSTLDSEGIKRSAAIYDRLVHYQSIVPQTVAQFEAHYQKVKNAPLDHDFFTTMRSSWNATYAAASIAKVQYIIDLYFPDGRPIESLPHFEDFEDGIGGWAQATDDNHEWRRHSGPTFSGAAGPDGAASGDYYMYAEGHDAVGGYKTTSLQCTFDFSGVRGAMMNFDYHMFGNYIDFLSVDVHDGTNWTSNVWNRSGPQHSSSSDAWSSAEVDLSAFGGIDEVTVRFRTKNTQYKSADPAIDNIRLEAAPETVPYAESFESGMGAWQQSQDDDFDWSIGSGETDSGNTGPTGASDGSQYLFVEGHDAGQYAMTSIECSFDLSTASGTELIFDYHMIGNSSDMGTLAVDVHDGTSWTSNVWNRSGNQQSAQSDPFLTAAVDLSSYVGNPRVTLRFRYNKAQWAYGDPAIDNVRVAASDHNYPPVATAQRVSVLKNSDVAITLSGSDFEGESLGYAFNQPPNGTLSGTAPNLIYTPDVGYVGVDSFTFTVNDGTQDSAPATVSITVEKPVIPPQVVFDATTGNTTIHANTGHGDNGVLSGTPGSLVYTTPANDFNHSGFTSSSDINTLLGSNLDAADTITLIITVDSITGSALRANGITMGLRSGTAQEADALGGRLDHNNSGTVTPVGQGAAAGDAVTPSGNPADTLVTDGFEFTLTANSNGYTMVWDDILSPSGTISISGSLTESEFLGLGSSHFYWAGQQFQNVAMVATFTEASISVARERGDDPEFIPGGTSISDGNLHMSFTGSIGYGYRIESTGDLTDTNGWTVVTNIVSLPESPMEVALPTTNSAAYYRVLGE